MPPGRMIKLTRNISRLHENIHVQDKDVATWSLPIPSICVSVMSEGQHGNHRAVLFWQEHLVFNKLL